MYFLFPSNRLKKGKFANSIDNLSVIQEGGGGNELSFFNNRKTGKI